MCRRWSPRPSPARASSPIPPAACTPTSTCMHGGATEATPATPPPGAYANSCVAREAMFQYFSRTRGTPGRIIRLNYAIDMRYGVLHDVASRVLAGQPINLATGHVNVIWQGDANAMVLRALGHCTVPSSPLNVSGPETVSVRWLARVLRRSAWASGRCFTGIEAAEGWLVNTAEAMRLFGYPSVPLAQARRLDRGLGRARPAEPGQGHPFRYPRWQVLSSRSTVKPSLSPSELDDAGALVREAGWNQIAADWRIFIAHGRVYAVQTAHGRIVATAATLPYGGRFAWISMVLVAGELSPPRAGDAADAPRDRRSHRRRPRAGARRHAGRPRGLSRARLRGFLGLAAAGRGASRASAAVVPRPPASPSAPITDADWPALVAYDAAAFGADRGAVLARLARTLAGGRAHRRARRPHRRLLARPRRTAGRADRPADRRGRRDCAARCSRARSMRSTGRCSSISPTPRREVRSFLDARGFTAARPFTRMLLRRVDALRRCRAHLRRGRAGVRVMTHCASRVRARRSAHARLDGYGRASKGDGPAIAAQGAAQPAAFLAARASAHLRMTG